MKKIFTPLNRFLSQQSKPAILLIGLVTVLVLGFLDYWTGTEYTFSLFYLFPILLVVWWGSRGAGLLLALLSAATWSVANYLAGEVYSSPLVALFNTAIRLAFYIVIILLLHQFRLSLEKERRLARTDPLTGAFNSRAFYEIAANRIERCRRKNRPLSLAYIDLDNFKYVNDHLGHLQGDEVLRAVAESLRSTLRSTDIIARMGGDEFIVFLPNTHPDAAEHAIQRARLALMERMQESRWPVTCSIGLVTSDCQRTDVQLDEIIRRADDAMYIAKKKGRNMVELSLMD